MTDQSTAARPRTDAEAAVAQTRAYIEAALAAGDTGPGLDPGVGRHLLRLLDGGEEAGEPTRSPLRDQIAAALAEVLASLYPLTRVDGSVIGYQTVNLIRPATYERWQAALNPLTPAATDATQPGAWLTAGTRDLAIPEQHRLTVRPVDPEVERAATERARRVADEARRASEQLAALNAPHTGLVVQPYRNDQGRPAWVFRCWGTDTCDGYLSLDHHSQQSAERARDRHLAEDHATLPAHDADPTVAEAASE
jgi:hypothetical protein